MSTPAFVRLQPDSTGKKIGTFEATVGSDTVELQAVVLVDSSGAEIAAATAANQATQITAEQAILAKIIAAPATEAKQDAEIVLVGSVTETAPLTDTASSGLNGRLQRIAQRLTSLIGLFPASIGQKAKAASLAVALPTDQVGAAGTAAIDVLTVQGIAGMTAVKVDGSGVTQPVSVASLPLPSGAALEAGHLATIDTSTAATSAVAGTTAGAAVTTNATGTLQQYLRGLVTLVAAKIGITIADGDNASLGAKADAFATTDTGTFSLIALFKRLLQGVTTIGTNTAASATNKGAANLITSQVTSTGSAATLAIARSTRRSVLFTNTHDTASVRIGPVTVTAGNGQILGPRESCPFTFIGLFQVIDDGATHCVICVADEYD